MARAQAPERQEEVVFRARGRNFRVVMQPAYDEPTNFGIRRHAGYTIEFGSEAEYRTGDPEEIEYLRRLPTLNREFWEVGAEPFGVPDPEPVIDRIMTATIELDGAALESIENEERAGYQREAVMTAVRRARARVAQASGDESG